MTGPRRVFLDTNIWNMLVDGASPFSVDDLVVAYRADRIQIVGTIELFEEIVATARLRPRKYQRMKSVWRKLVGSRILLTFSDRHRAELVYGGLLNDNDRYQPARVRRGLGQLSHKSAIVGQINEEVHRRKHGHRTADLAMRDEVLGAIAALGKKPKDFERSVNDNTVFELVREIVRAGPTYGMPTISDSAVSYERLPSAWLLVGVTAARVTRVAGENRRVSDSDNHDRLHASAAGYFDALVTDDNEYRATLSIVPNLPCEILTADGFADWLRED